ncbi:GMC oxidoreductase [Rhypophila sp. PSN 637]
MDSQAASTLTSSVPILPGPKCPGLPTPPTGDFFDDTQWTVLFALFDAILPSITATPKVTDDKSQYGIPEADIKHLIANTKKNLVEPPSDDLLEAYLADRPSTDPNFTYGVRRILSTAPSSALKQLGAVLTALSTRPGSLILTGYVVPLHEQPIHIRESILQAWSKSWFGTPRTLFKSFTVVAKAVWAQTNPLLKQVTGFPDVPVNWKPGKTEDFGFLQFGAEAETDDAVIDTDVVIVGSGCGGAVVAKTLAEAGHRVLVVDKGYYYPPEQLPMTQEQGAYHLYENNGIVNSIDNSINVAAGSCWGGGGSINWSVSLQTQGYVRQEWAEVHGLPFFQTAEYQASLDRVCDFMGVSDVGVKQSHRGQKLLDGARKLGLDAKVCPQNSGGKEHWCGHCHLGCGSGEKQGPAVSWLPTAAKNGAQFIEGFAVDKILWDETTRGKNAVGVVGTWTSRDANGTVLAPMAERTTRTVTIKAKKVVVSGGTLNSPLVLMRSGLKNPHIGRNLHLHPVNFIAGYFDEDARPWEGGIITSVCTSFENLDGHGHGSKLEATCMLPYAILNGMPWLSGLDFKLAALRLRYMGGYISLARDRDTGRVYPDPTTGKPTIDYTPSPFDTANVLEGLIGMAKILHAAGATEIRPFVPGVEPFVRSSDTQSEIDLGITDPEFVAWLATIRAAGNKPPHAAFTSAHQMGTCRMSSHSGEGVVDARGKVWEAENLYVADASVFPSASGVNPMITVMAIADWIARGIVSDLKGQK